MEPLSAHSLVEQLASRDYAHAAQAEKRLLALGDAGMEAVLAGMTHAVPKVRRACAGFMDHHGDYRCIACLTERLLHDEVAHVRREAVHSLTCDRCKETPLSGNRLVLLQHVLRTDSSVKVRREACFAIGQLAHDERAQSELHRVLREEEDKLMRKYAHDALYHYDPLYRKNCIKRTRENQTT